MKKILGMAVASVFFATTFLLSGCGSSGSPSTQPPSALPQQPGDVLVQSTFSSIEKQIFSQRCISCHSGATPASGIDLTSYDSLVASAAKHGHPLFVAGNLQDSHAYEAVQDGSMPPGGPALTAAQVQAIGDWIMAGALNN